MKKQRSVLMSLTELHWKPDVVLRSHPSSSPFLEQCLNLGEGMICSKLNHWLRYTCNTSVLSLFPLWATKNSTQQLFSEWGGCILSVFHEGPYRYGLCLQVVLLFLERSHLSPGFWVQKCQVQCRSLSRVVCGSVIIKSRLQKWLWFHKMTLFS